MTSTEEKLREYLKLVTADLRQTRQRLESAEARYAEPIAIIGMSCRFPGGVRSPEDLWRLVEAGGDAMGDFPADRGWNYDLLYDADPEHSGRSYANAGGFLYDAPDFDAGFFGISPREALAMDPQQRVLLETSWEVFERAGVDPGSVRGSRTGVFIGAIGMDYIDRLGPLPEGVEGYSLTGSMSSVVSGRIAYTFGLEGPAITIDTACSSSLVALHWAGQSLRAGECSLALAGGVAVMPTPTAFVEFSRQRALSPDGRCKAFAASADGTGWSEGVGVLLLERLSDAVRNGHRIWGVVRGSATNQDGASSGLSAPNGPSQQRVILDALESAGIPADQVDVVEAHGTGTKLGDPIEAQALQATYGARRTAEQPLWLGSVKSNIGHTQAAAGVAGVIKMVMAMRHGVLPPTLHIDELNPQVDWSAGTVVPLTAGRAWPDQGRPRRAGVSAFGISGTNAHIILEQAPAQETPEIPQHSGPVAWLLSARTDAGLQEMAGRLADAVDELPVQDVAHSLAGRAALEHRAVVVGTGRDELVAGLRALPAGLAAPNLVRDEADPHGRKTVFVFPGQGSQWRGMALDLAETNATFATHLDACIQALAPYVTVRLDDPELLSRVELVQPALFAVMVSLARLWQEQGVEPAAVIGHSQGEIAAAHVAGALTLDDAARIVALRARAITRLAGTGGMVSVPLPAEQVELPDDVWIAAHNSPAGTVVAGSVAGLDRVLATYSRARKIDVDYASHTPHVEALRDQILADLAGIAPRPSAVPVYSTLTGGPVEAGRLDATYWYENLRRTVLFEPTLRLLAEDGYDTFVECSPHPVLTIAVQETLPEAHSQGTLRRGEPGPTELLTAFARAHAAGLPVGWNFPGRHVDLPTYPFQRRRYWLEQQPVSAPSFMSTMDSLRYDVEWRPVSAHGVATGRWLMVFPEAVGDTAVACDRVLTAQGASVVPVPVEAGTTDRAALVAALTTAAAGEPVAGILSFLADDVRSHPQLPSLTRGLAGTVLLVQAVADADLSAPIWCVTRNAVAALPADPAPAPEQAQLWGLGRTAALEQPGRWGGLIDLPAALDERALTRLGAVLAGSTGEDQVALRTSGALGRRLVRAPRRRGGPAAPAWQPSGTVLVTGASGSIGGHLARWLAGAGAEHLVLTSRRGRDADGVAELEAELIAAGARVTVAACDVADRDALAALLTELRRQGQPIRAVFHTAAVVDLAPITETTLERLATNLSAKVTGAHWLDELVDDTDLEAFVLFSSMAGVWGSGEHAGYAAANAHLDALAARRRARGLPGTSIAWGIWDAFNDHDEHAGHRREALSRRAREQGLPMLDPQLAFTAMQQVVAGGEAFAAVTEVDWDRFTPLFVSGRHSRLLEGLPEAQRAIQPAEPDTGGSSPLALRLAGASAAEQDRILLELVRSQAAAVLGHTDVEAVAARRAFKDIGFDSLTAVELRNRLGKATGVSVPASLIFDHPNPAAVTAFLREQLLGVAAVAPDVPPSAPVRSDEPVAIVAMACRYPGGVSSPEDLWQMLTEERDGISGFPQERGWDVERLYDPDPDVPGKSYVREGGFLHEAGDFDAELFGISPREAIAMDPQQRLVLETAWETFERAGIDPMSLRGSPAGVFVGAKSPDYLLDLPQGLEGHLVTGANASVISGRVAYTFGLEGPAVTVDTACSSSLVALHLAMQAVRSGECSMALAGGVTVFATPGIFVGFSQQRGLAVDGRCKSFSADADGMGVAEG
ncbi:type I polyketide synthase, partial [Paractinoplanes durhamensis]